MSIWGALEQYAKYFALMGAGSNDEPDTKSPLVVAWQEDLKLVRTLYDGWRKLYQYRSLYLPQHPKEDPQDYFIRANRRTFYNAFGRTVRALTGNAFGTEPTPEGVPAEILKFYEDDIDNEGTAGTSFVRRTFQDALTTGMAGIFVDMPVLEQPEGAEATRLQELEAGLRPFWTMVQKDDIVSFRTVVENGATLLSQLVYCEYAQRPKRKFGVQIVERLRAFRRLPVVPRATETPAILWENYERDQGKTKWVSVASGQLPIVTEIPFAQVYTERLDFMHSAPPLLDLANVNLLHYQVSSDLHHAVHIANVPFLFGGGFDAENMQIGPNRAVIVPSGVKREEAWLNWTETTGAALGSTRAVLADLEEQMAHLGLGMLQRKSRAAETAEKATLDRKDQESTLGAAVSELENGLEQALHWTAQYMGLQSGGRFSFSRDFEQDPAAANQTENQGKPGDPKEPKQPGETNNPKTTS